MVFRVLYSELCPDVRLGVSLETPGGIPHLFYTDIYAAKWVASSDPALDVKSANIIYVDLDDKVLAGQTGAVVALSVTAKLVLVDGSMVLWYRWLSINDERRLLDEISGNRNFMALLFNSIVLFQGMSTVKCGGLDLVYFEQGGVVIDVRTVCVSFLKGPWVFVACGNCIMEFSSMLPVEGAMYCSRWFVEQDGIIAVGSVKSIDVALGRNSKNEVTGYMVFDIMLHREICCDLGDWCLGLLFYKLSTILIKYGLIGIETFVFENGKKSRFSLMGCYKFFTYGDLLIEGFYKEGFNHEEDNEDETSVLIFVHASCITIRCMWLDANLELFRGVVPRMWSQGVAELPQLFMRILVDLLMAESHCFELTDTMVAWGRFFALYLAEVNIVQVARPIWIQESGNHHEGKLFDSGIVIEREVNRVCNILFKLQCCWTMCIPQACRMRYLKCDWSRISFRYGLLENGMLIGLWFSKEGVLLKGDERWVLDEEFYCNDVPIVSRWLVVPCGILQLLLFWRLSFLQRVFWCRTTVVFNIQTAVTRLFADMIGACFVLIGSSAENQMVSYTWFFIWSGLVMMTMMVRRKVIGISWMAYPNVPGCFSLHGFNDAFKYDLTWSECMMEEDQFRVNWFMSAMGVVSTNRCGDVRGESGASVIVAAFYVMAAKPSSLMMELLHVKGSLGNALMEQVIYAIRWVIEFVSMIRVRRPVVLVIVRFARLGAFALELTHGPPGGTYVGCYRVQFNVGDYEFSLMVFRICKLFVGVVCNFIAEMVVLSILNDEDTTSCCCFLGWNRAKSVGENLDIVQFRLLDGKLMAWENLDVVHLRHFMVHYLLILLTMGFVRHVPSLNLSLLKAPE